MTNIHRIERLLAGFPLAAAMLYVVLIGLFVFATVSTMLDLLERRSTVSAAADVLAQIEGRGSARARAGIPTDVTVPTGSPFVEGATVSVAGATLLQRVATAMTQASGNVASSQVDLQGSESKAGFVTVTMSLEIEPTSLQQLLYDLESGMPFLFVDQLVAQAPDSTAAGGKMRVLLSVSGQWQGAK
jgi:general secretion pathway protein M